jgi:hypothetical protein
MQLFPNPYHHIDHKSRLAGRCYLGEAVRKPTEEPRRELAGAVSKVVSFSPPASETQMSKTDVMPLWTGEPITVLEDVDGFYWERLRCRELFEVVGEGEVLVHAQVGEPQKMSLLDALVGARAEAFARYRAERMKDPDTSLWAKQFPHEEDVAKVHGEQLASAEKKAKEAAEKAEQEAKSAPADAPAEQPEAPKKYSLTPPKKDGVPSTTSEQKTHQANQPPAGTTTVPGIGTPASSLPGADSGGIAGDGSTNKTTSSAAKGGKG